MSRFAGARVMVTGASRGLGRGIALAFGREGAHVFVGFHRHQAEAEATVAAIRAEGASAQALGFDLRDPDTVKRAFESVAASLPAAESEERGALDVLVNNAGVGGEGLFPLIDDAAFSEVVDTNLLGTVRCSREAVRLMWRRRGGTIVNIASASALVGTAGLTSYAASKGGILSLTRSLAVELAPRGIRVNAVVPGLLDTGITAHLDARKLARLQERVALGRLGTADEVARAVLFLASPESTYIVGQALIVDGGLSL